MNIKACSTCKFFDPIESQQIEQMGFCRISPPQLDGWPKACATDWCGAHQSASDDLIDEDDLALDLSLDNPGDRVPQYDNPKRPIEALDVVLMDSYGGYRGVTGVVQKVEGDTIHVMICGTAYPIPRSEITERVGRTGGARQ